MRTWLNSLNYFSVPGGLSCCQWLASLKRRDSCHGSKERAKTNAEDAKVSLRARRITWVHFAGFCVPLLRGLCVLPFAEGGLMSIFWERKDELEA